MKGLRMKISWPASGGAHLARVFVAIMLIQIATAGVACAQRRPAAGRGPNIVYEVPQGWRRVEQGETQLLIPPDLPQGESCVLIVLPGEELRGDFRAAFDAARGELESGERVLETSDVTAEKNPAGYETLYSLAVTNDRRGARTYRLYLAAHPGSRFEMIVYAASGEELFKRYQPAVLDFVKSIGFANLNPARASSSPPPPSSSSSWPAPARGGQKLEGLYVGTESRQQFNVATKFYDYIVRQVYYLFLPGGRVYRGLPQGGGLDDFDCERAGRESAQGCGAYQLSGDTIQFTWTTGDQSSPFAFRRSADRVQIGATTYFRVEPADRRRLAGVYARKSFTNLSGGAGVSSGGVSGETAIAFDGGGQFESAGFVGFAGGGGGADAAASSGQRDVGAYRIEGTTLELTHADGRRTRHTAFLMPKEENVLVIDGVSYLKRGN